MTFEEFQKFIDSQDALFRALGRASKDEQGRIFSRTIKIGEEYGELCDAVLTSVGDQRNDKLKAAGRDNLAGEFADVIITTFLLAKAMDIEMNSAIENKIKKIQEKHNKQLT